MADHGIRAEYNIPYNLELNGVAERMNRTLVEKARTMMHESQLPKSLWSEAIMAATYLVNRSPTAALVKKTPFEMWHKRQPDISNLRVFGCRAFVHIPKEKRKKFDQASTEAVMVGYDINGYRLYDRQKIIVQRNVVFDERPPAAQTIGCPISTSVEVPPKDHSPDGPQDRPLSQPPSDASPLSLTSPPTVPHSDSEHETQSSTSSAPAVVQTRRYSLRSRGPPSRLGLGEPQPSTGNDTGMYSYCAAAFDDDVPKTFDISKGLLMLQSGTVLWKTK